MGELIPFDAGRPPAVLANRTSSLNDAAMAGVQASFAVVGFKGRNWRLKYRGEETLLMDANKTPLPFLDVVIVGVSSAISKQWYADKYTEGSSEAPDCFSVDGISPDPSSPKKQSPTCAACPKNIWGSRMTDAGKKAKDCQDSRRLALLPHGDHENESYGGPMLLRIPPTTLSNLANYAAMLKQKGAALEYVVTRLKFDYDVAYPLIEFEARGWLSNEDALELVGADGVSGLLAEFKPQIERMLNEAVVEATHDPAVPATTTVVADPLAQGAPAQVFQHPSTPVQGPAPATSAQAAPSVAETTSAPTVAAPRKRRAASPFQQAVQQAPAEPAPAAAPAPTPVAAPTVVQEMPEDMNSLIDGLLAG